MPLIEQTRRAEAAGASERSRFLLDTVLDSLTIGVIITDPDGELILMNKVLRESPELTANGADPWESYRHAPAFDADGVPKRNREREELEVKLRRLGAIIPWETRQAQ